MAEKMEPVGSQKSSGDSGVAPEASNCMEKTIPELETYFYVKNATVLFEEDQIHEFKDHRVLTWDDLPPQSILKLKDRDCRYQLSHQPISRTLCSFLNSRLGGTIYSGIEDDGTVKGFVLNQYQIDHISLAFTNLFSRFDPVPPTDMRKLRFIPVVSSNSLTDIERPSTNNPRLRKQAHSLQTYFKCWCQNNHKNVTNARYVIEYVIFPTTDVASSPMYRNEEGVAYIRYCNTIRRAERQALVDEAQDMIAIANNRKMLEKAFETMTLNVPGHGSDNV